MLRQMRRSQNFVDQFLPMRRERLHDSTPSFAVRSQAPGGGLDASFQDDCRAVIERMRQGGRGFDPLQPVLGQGQAPEKGRANPQWIKRRTDVVNKTGQGQFGLARPATDLILRLENQNGESCLCASDGGGKAVWARADHYDVECVGGHQ
jgi:hypothetical protein